MKQFIFALICILGISGVVSARGQVAPAATTRGLSLNAGGFGSVFQPDYAGTGFAATSPNRLYGFGAYFDFRFNRWVQIEGETRWLHINEYYGINEDSYLIGPKIPIHTWKRFTPYGKVLFGLGEGSFLSGGTGAIAYGGGVDYQLTRKLTLRPFDVEYQQWHVEPTLWPYGASVGIAYKIF